MKMPWRYDGKDSLIHGFADYCLWYGLPDGIETNLVIVEAKAKELSSSGEAQLLTWARIGAWSTTDGESQ